MTRGFVRGMEAVLKEGEGRLPWGRLVDPAAELAGEGVAGYPDLEKYYTLEGGPRPGYPDIEQKLAGDTPARRRYLPGGSPIPRGAVLPQPEYARTLERVGSQGADEFYIGGVSRAMAADLAEHGGFVTAGDLGTYRVRVGPPLASTFGDLTVSPAPPPPPRQPLWPSPRLPGTTAQPRPDPRRDVEPGRDAPARVDDVERSRLH